MQGNKISLHFYYAKDKRKRQGCDCVQSESNRNFVFSPPYLTGGYKNNKKQITKSTKQLQCKIYKDKKMVSTFTLSVDIFFYFMIGGMIKHNEQ